MQKALTHIHFLCTVAGVLLVGSLTSVALVLFSIGARSLPLSVIYGVFVFSRPETLAEICINWLWVFPIVYLVLYILAVIKKRYALFGIAIALDTAFRCIMTVLVHKLEGISGLSEMIFDAILSLGICALFFYAGYMDKKRRNRTSGENVTQ